MSTFTGKFKVGQRVQIVRGYETASEAGDTYQCFATGRTAEIVMVIRNGVSRRYNKKPERGYIVKTGSECIPFIWDEDRFAEIPTGVVGTEGNYDRKSCNYSPEPYRDDED